MAFSEASHTPENVIQQAEREARLKHLVKELFELDESDLASLRERIEKNSGRIELLIHPFFEKHHISRDDYDLRDEESKLVELDTTEAFKEMFTELWPKALLKLKELIEQH
jgi:hypothetical protein